MASRLARPEGCRGYRVQQYHPTKTSCRTISDRIRRWHGAWRARVEATQRVATCITRKRVAFRQFKAWYWQCFDTNVQVLHHCQLPAQAAAHPEV